MPQLAPLEAWSQYLVDSVERAVLFWDVLRQRGNSFLENCAKGEPPVLRFGHDVLIDGRKLDRPCNYALMAIRPPEGVAIDPAKRPVVVVDPRAGQGPGVGGFKLDSEIGFAFRAGHPVYFIGFYPEPVPGQTLVDIGRAESRFLEEVIRRHPGPGNKPFVIGNCQAGWAVAALAAVRPELTGPVAFVGAPLSYWAGAESQNPMGYNGGIFGGTWPGYLLADLGGGIIDGAWFVQNFENLDPANTLWKKPYDLYSRVDTEAQRFLDFERWWGGYYLMTKEEYREIVDNLFAGNRLARGIELPGGLKIDLKNITSPVVVFASWGDNISPPQQALNWIEDVYGHEDEIVAKGRVIVYLLAEDVGHLSIFVGSRVARKEHRELISVMEMLDDLPPGLYEMVIEERPKHADPLDIDRDTYTVRFETRTMDDIRALNPDCRRGESLYSTVNQVSEITERLYESL
jgi:pimeloyl-ACP methyl ester carboxylesterase